MSLVINYYGKDRNYFQYPQIKESGSRGTMILNLSQKAKSLIIKAIRKTDIYEIMPIPIARFAHFSTPISVRAPFLSNSHLLDFQYIPQPFQPFLCPPKGSRFYLCSLLNRTFLRKCPFFVSTPLQEPSFEFEIMYFAIKSVILLCQRNAIIQ